MANMFWDLQSTALLGQSISPAAATTASANGSSVDVSKASGPISLLVTATSVSGTTPKAVMKLQYSPDGGTTWTDCPADGGQQTNSLTFTEAGVGILTTSEPLGKSVRAVATITGTTPSFVLDAVVIAQKQIVGNGTGTQLNFTPGSGF